MLYVLYSNRVHEYTAVDEKGEGKSVKEAALNKTEVARGDFSDS